MIKPLLGLAATGVAAAVLYKVMLLVLLPLVGVTIGIVVVIIKVFFVLLLLTIAYWIYRRSTRDSMA